jgi:Holliday junction resolvase-like predicted endonuclease
MFHEGKRLVRFLQEIAIYDGMFTLKQSRPSDVERTVRTLFAWVSDADAARLGFTIGQAAVVARWIMKQVRNVRGPFAFQDSDIKRQVSLVAPSIIDDVLAIYTHTAATNSTFSLPHEQNAVDFWFRPLLHHPAGHYVVADGSWCAPAFYEAILGALRRSGVSELDTKIGTAFEDLVKTELTKHNVTYVCGRYNQSGCEGECDLVVETDDTIILLELKKKSLTRAARSGSDIDIIFDVAESLLAAQTQLGQHERLLYEDGFLTLNSAGLMCSLDRRGRQIERVAVSLLDFGALQDRNLLSQIMLTVTGFNFDSANSVHANKIHAIQLLCEELRQQYEKLAQLRNRRDASLFMNCWFLSLGHLRQILDGVSSNDEFRRSLFVTRHVVMSTLDLYFEHEEMLRIKRKAHPP